MNGQGHDRSALVLYGTETGTSQDLAEEIGRGLERIHFNTDILGLDAVHHSHLSNYEFTVFVVSTTGQGDFPENARKFWTGLLRKKLSSTTLAGIDYALVGIGDSSYLKFNWAARKLDKRLRQLGATQLLHPCEADEQGDEGTEGAFLAWLSLFRDAILNAFPLADGQDPIPDDVALPSKWRLERTTGGVDVNGVHSAASNGQQGSLDSFPVILETNQRVTPSEHWQDVRYMSLKASHKINYMPGDAIAISPRNIPSDVESLIDRMKWHHIADTPIRLVSTRPSSDSNSALLVNNPILTHVNLTLRILLTEYLDINAIPRRSFLGCIANYTADSMHKERLLEFTEPQYLDEYFDYATRPRRSILEILQEFDTVHLPWEEVTNIFPLMRPRQFSIASGGALKQADDGTTRFELLIAIVKYKTVIKRIREGVCTRYLARLPAGTRLQVSLKTEGRFSAPTDNLARQNHILIGAGTGIAPLRALVYDKAAAASSAAVASDPTTTRGRTALIFGCRNEKADFFFHDEWPAQQAAGLELITAFSRDQSSKVYVQDRIRGHAALVWELLRRQNATVIVCGSSGQMPKAVKQAVMDALVEEESRRKGERETHLLDGVREDQGEDEDNDDDEDGEPITSQDAAERYIAWLEKGGRYRQETW